MKLPTTDFFQHFKYFILYSGSLWVLASKTAFQLSKTLTEVQFNWIFDQEQFGDFFGLAEHTVSYQYQAGLVGSFPILQLEGEGALICRGQRLHDHLNHGSVLVEVHLVFLQTKTKKITQKNPIIDIL